MAFAVIRATLGQSLGNGTYNSSAAGVGDKVTALDTAVTAAIAASAAVTANATVAADPTALGLAQASDTAIAAVSAAQTVVKTGNMAVIVNMAVITDRNKFRSAMRAIEQAAFSGTV
jgi:hypothetical protein